MNRKGLTELEDMLDNLDPEGQIVDEHYQDAVEPFRTLHITLVNGNQVTIFEDTGKVEDASEEELGLTAQAILQLGSI